MATKDWAAPLVAAIATFGGLLALPDPEEGPGRQAEGTASTAPRDVVHADLLFPFEAVWIDADVRSTSTSTTTFTLPTLYVREPGTTVLALLRPPIGEDDPCPMAHSSRFQGGTVIDASYFGQCLGPGIARYSLPRGGASNGGSVNIVVAREGPRLGEAGYNATRVTVHVFDDGGGLIASNGNASEQARLGGHDAQGLPGGVWYLGADATVPDGTQRLPGVAGAFLGQLRPLLAGLPVGGVTVTQTDVLRDLYGTLHITAQADELVHAP